MKLFLNLLITLYQKTLSPDHSWMSAFFPCGYCRFYPTCSDYAKELMESRGVLRGTVLGAWRIARCHPWSKGGIDFSHDAILSLRSPTRARGQAGINSAKNLAIHRDPSHRSG